MLNRLCSKGIMRKETVRLRLSARKEKNTDSTRIGKRKCILCVDWSKDLDNYNTLIVGEEQ